MRRPLGVTIISILVIAGGIVGIVNGLYTFGTFGAAAVKAGDAASAERITYGISDILVGALGLLVGIGLWLLWGWVWAVALLIIIASLVIQIVGLLAGRLAAPLINLVIDGVVLWYLTRPDVRMAFR